MKWKGSAQILLNHILPLCRIPLNEILQNQMNMLNLIGSIKQCANERNARLILVSTIIIIVCFFFSAIGTAGVFLQTIIETRKVKTMGKKVRQGFLNEKRSTCKILVSFKQTKNHLNCRITCFTRVFFNIELQSILDKMLFESRLSL